MGFGTQGLSKLSTKFPEKNLRGRRTPDFTNAHALCRELGLCSWTAPDFWAFLIQARTAVTSMTMPPRQWHSFDKLVGTPGNLQKHRWTMFMLQRFARSFALFMLMFKRMHDHIRWPMMFSRNPKVYDMFTFFQCLFSLEHLETPESDELRP